MRPRRRIRAVALVCAVLSALAGSPPAHAAPEQVRIVRDRFGVPHVFAQTSRGAAFGTGYALAQDRLWQMHVFRSIAKGRLSELLGPAVVDIDKTVRFFTYTAEERARRAASYPDDIRGLLDAFVDGVNTWIHRAQTDPRHMPFEFVEFGVQPIPEWTLDDTLALQDVLILAFGSGGGNELEQAALLQDLVDRFGEARGKRVFDDLVVTEDPDGPMTIPRRYPYADRPTFARETAAEARRSLTADARLGLAAGAGALDGSGGPAAIGTLPQLSLLGELDGALRAHRRLTRGLDALKAMFAFGSNAQIVGPSMSEAGNSAQTGGPQVGYSLPQWLADVGIHGGKLDAMGMTFAGSGPAVLIGRGRGFAWTTTTGASDLTDTYVEQLDESDSRRYLWNGESEPMDCRTETYTFRGVPFDRDEICRTRHGPVLSFDEEGGVAFSLRYAWFNREGQTVEGFFRYNQVRSLADFATFANFLSSNHNMFYTDDQGNFGYWHPGNHPVRQPGVDLRLPQDGTGGSEWAGLVPVSEVPHAVNIGRGWLANWNNQPAAGWTRERGWPALDNVLDLEDALDPAGPDVADPFGGLVNPDGSVDFGDLSANLRYAAFKHHRHTYFRAFLPRRAALPAGLARRALDVVRAWDGFLVDRNGDGRYDSAGVTIVDRWVQEMSAAAFGDDLGDLSRWATESLLWHVLAPDDRLALRFDWLNGGSPAALATGAFERAVADLAEEHGNRRPSSWRAEAEMEHYQRLNADLFADLLGQSAGADTSEDSGLPGDVPDHIAMDRGTYNHVVVYQTPPTGSPGLGHAASRAGSVIPPGQCGFIDLAGRECPHYRDQLDLYVDWRYKPMPLSLREARAGAESVELISFSG